jgi:CheY-like chemotaxis protein
MTEKMEEERKKILVVDDSELDRAIISGFVDERYDVLEARDAQEAYAILMREGGNVILATIDIFMPGKSGLELLADIRREPSLSIWRSSSSRRTTTSKAPSRRWTWAPPTSSPNRPIRASRRAASAT